MKKFVELLLFSSLSINLAFGVDFSKKSDEEILNLAKSVKSEDQADLIIEAKKRMNEMKYKDAINFHSEFQTNLHENISKLSPKERQQRKTIVQKDMMKLTDKMSGKEIRELNLHHKKLPSYNHRNSSYEHCPMR